jgi:hypothetical protein
MVLLRTEAGDATGTTPREDYRLITVYPVENPSEGLAPMAADGIQHRETRVPGSHGSKAEDDLDLPSRQLDAAVHSDSARDRQARRRRMQ